MERSFPEQAVARDGNGVMNFSGHSHGVFKLHFLANDLCMTPISDFKRVIFQKHFHTSIDAEWWWCFNCTVVVQMTAPQLQKR